MKDMEPEDKERQSKSSKFMEFMFCKFKEFLNQEKQTSWLQKQIEESYSFVPTCHHLERKGI